MTNTTRAFWNSTILLSALAAGVASQTTEKPQAPAEVPAQASGASESTPGATASNEIEWQTDVATALELAREQNKIAYEHVIHAGCGPCEMLKRNIFPEASVVSRLNGRFVAVQVDRYSEQGQAVVNKYKLENRDPVDVFSRKGRFVVYYGAPQTVGDYLKRLADAELRLPK
jgi:thioredoxin-related protein